MYKALIVDDEKLIRSGMHKAIPWGSIGICDVFLAKSGNEALSIIREQKPEIMISDIKMDGMTGLELIAKAKKIVPGMKVLVLTGYDEFEYARRCIQLNVNDFFLKPIDEKNLISAIRKQVEVLSNMKKDNRKDRAKAVTEQMDIENILRDLIHNRCDTIRSESFCAEFGYNAKQDLQAAVLAPVLYLDSRKEDEYFTAITVKKICIGLVDARNRGLTFIDDYGRVVIAFFINKHKNSALDWLQEITSILMDEFDRPPKAAVGNPVSGFTQLSISYNDAIHLLKYENDVYNDIIQTSASRGRNNLFRDIFTEMKAIMCANIGDADRVMSIYDRFCQAADSYNLSNEAVERFCFELASSMQYSFSCHTGKEADERLGAFINGILNTRAEEQLEITRLFLIKLLGGREEQKNHEIVDKAKRFIMDHLSEELSVTDIAAFIFVTPNYLSRLFKKTTGEGCYEYVVRKRIEKAKLLLETTNLKPCKIAEMVGYNDTNYFSLAVKKNTGMSPQKYRKEFQKTDSVCYTNEC